MSPRLRKDLSSEVQAALAEADQLMASDLTGNIHSVGWGVQITRGQERNRKGIIFTVQGKGPVGVVGFSGSKMLPQFIGDFHTDVQEQPEQKIQLLHEPWLVQELVSGVHKQCHNTPIPGGVEIFPLGKAWVGTLGCKVVYRFRDGKLHHGAITNWHVATGKEGQQLGQPGGNSEWFAFVVQSPGVKFNGTNQVDLSVLDIERIGGKYGADDEPTHTVKAEQVTLGAYSDELSKGGVGTQVARDGRTLGCITNGRVTQIGATVRVGYGSGKSALFTDQFVCTRQGGEFSAPGDSGSMVFEYPNMKPFGLLFAGGGGTTIVSPAEFVISQGGVIKFA